MKNWRTVAAIILTLGLANFPFVAGAQEEEGSGAGHEAHGAKDGDARAHEGMKKEAKSEGEAKKAGATGEGASTEHQHDGHDVHKGSHGGMEEGSH